MQRAEWRFVKFQSRRFFSCGMEILLGPHILFLTLHAHCCHMGTAILCQTYEFRNPVTETTEPVDRPPLRNKLPEPTGDNKYTNDMVPGYTGFTPHRCIYRPRIFFTARRTLSCKLDRHCGVCEFNVAL